MDKIFTEVLSSCSLRAAIKGPSPAFRQRVRGCHAEKKTQVEPEGMFTKHVETTTVTFVKVPSCYFNDLLIEST